MQRKQIGSGIGTLILFVSLSAAPALAAGQLSWQAVGQIGGPTQGVAVQGHYAYVGVGLRLVVLDISDPADLREVGVTRPFPNFVEDVAVSGTLAYVAAGGAGLRVVDISNPAAPNEVGAWDSRGYAQGVTVADSIAYLADGPYGMCVVDVSKPTQPVEVGSAYALNYACKVAVQGRYAYIAAAGAGLLIADVTNPTHPVETGSLGTTGYAYGVAVAGSIVFLADGWEGLKTIDVSNPSHPANAGSLHTAGWALHVTVWGTTAYVADAFGGMRVIDAADTAHPVETASSKMAGAHAGSVAVDKNFAYVADRNWGLRAVNLSGGPLLSPAGGYRPISYAETVAVAGGYAYVGEPNAGLRIVDISNPARPKQVAAIDVPGSRNYVAVRGNFAYLSSVTPNGGDAVLRVLDITDPAHPVLKGSVGTGGSRDLDVVGGIAYLPTAWGLELVSVSDPAHPASIGYLEMRPTLSGEGTTNGVALEGTTAYVSSSRHGLKTVDVSDPRQPRLVAAFATDLTFSQDVVLSGKRAYVVDEHRLVVVDISDPAHLVGRGSAPVPGATGASVSEGLAYVAAGATGFYVVDVRDPVRPFVAGTFTGRGRVSAVVAAGDHLYAADGPGRLLILERTGTAAGGNDTLLLVADTTSQPPPPARISPAPASSAELERHLSARISAAQGSGGSCVVTSIADAGPGTLRQCLADSLGGETITFDSTVFNATNPATIALESPLPVLNRGGITIDASHAGVIIDGKKTTGSGFSITSDNNAIMGLQITRFPKSAVSISSGARSNRIGGDRRREADPRVKETSSASMGFLEWASMVRGRTITS